MTFFNQILELDQLARQEAAKHSKKRALYEILLGKQGRHFLGIAGPRGVGKTILLKQLNLALKDSLYISADTIQDNQLFDIARHAAEKLKTRNLLVDEIHFQKGFDSLLKRIYDFLDIRVIFTSSMSLRLNESAYDLSRRVEILPLSPFNFREYVRFKHGYDLPALTLEDILDRRWTPDHLRFGFAFEIYLKGGLMPFALEEPDVLVLARNILNTVITRDIPTVTRVQVDELRLLENVMSFIGRSPSEDINPTSIAKNTRITRYKADAYIRWLQQAFVLNPVMPAGTNVRREPKVLMHLPYRLLYADYQACIGSLREDFFAEMMHDHGMTCEYLKSVRGEKTPDFLVRQNTGDIVVEIGGRSKGREQFKNFGKPDRKLVLAQGTDLKETQRPLFLLGCL